MIGLDTDVLVRFLVEDDAEQTDRAVAALHRGSQRGERYFVSDIVLCELIWVLRRSYRIPRAEIAAELRRLLATAEVDFQSADRLPRLLTAWEAGGPDLSDLLVLETARRAGCSALLSFDAKLLALEGVTSP